MESFHCPVHKARNLSSPSAEEWGIENRERKKEKELYTPWSCPDMGVVLFSQVSQHRSTSIQYNFVHKLSFINSDFNIYIITKYAVMELNRQVIILPFNVISFWIPGEVLSAMLDLVQGKIFDLCVYMYVHLNTPTLGRWCNFPLKFGIFLARER